MNKIEPRHKNLKNLTFSLIIKMLLNQMFGVTSATLGFLQIFATLTVLYILSKQTIISRDSIMLKIYFVEIE